MELRIVQSFKELAAPVKEVLQVVGSFVSSERMLAKATAWPIASIMQIYCRSGRSCGFIRKATLWEASTHSDGEDIVVRGLFSSFLGIRQTGRNAAKCHSAAP